MRNLTGALATLLLSAGIGSAQAATDVAIGMSGWTGFAPLTLAKAAELLLELGIIRSKPDIETIIDTRFIGG